MILHLYQEEELGCVNRLEGMFAFAIWDQPQRRLLLARDPIGIKPLYFAQIDGGFLFASEVKALLRSRLIPDRVRAQALREYLTFGSVIDPFTFVEGIEALPAGSYLTWEKGRASIERYWRPKIASRDDKRISESEAVANVKLLLESAVRKHMVADVPVGLFLSGGMDSSAIVSLLAAQGFSSLNTFSIVFDEADHSEAPYSRAIAARWRTSHCELKIGHQQVLTSLPAAVRAMDQPTIDGINTYTISGEVRRAGMKVALTGLGGDELFAGYPTFRSVPRMETFERLASYSPRVLRHCAAALVREFFKPGDRRDKLAASVAGNEPWQPYAISRMLFTTAQQRAILRLGVDRCNSGKVLNPDGIDLDRTDPVNRVSYLELRNYMLNTLLRDSDCMSMAHGLELRVPLLDRKLVEYMLTIPGHLKIDRNTPKVLLARATQGILPRVVVNRPKRGFLFLFQHWLREELRPEVESVLFRKDGPLSEFFDVRAVRGIWENFLRGRTNWSRPWSIYVAKKWTECHLQAGGAS